MKNDSLLLVERKPFLLRFAERADSAIKALSVMVVVSTLISIFCALLLEVIVRYVTKNSLGWPYEIPNLAFPWFVMIGIVLAAQKGSHVSVELIHTFLNKTLNKLLLCTINLISVAIFSYLAWVCIEVIETVGAETFPVTGVSASWVYLSMQVGFVGLALTGITNTIKLIYAENPLLIRKSEEKSS